MKEPSGHRPASSVAKSLRRLLGELQHAPGNAPKSYASLATAIGVDTVTLWRHRKAFQDVRELADTIVNAGKAGRIQRARPQPIRATLNAPGKAPVISEEPTSSLNELREAMRSLMDEARWSMQRYLSKTRRFGHPADLPRVAFELKRSVAEASAALEALTELLAEWEEFERRTESLSRG